MKPIDLYLRIFVVIIAFIQPLIIIYNYGIILSISTSWGTNLQPFFIITNILTAVLFLNTQKWLIPAILLVMLTAFSVELYPVLHTRIAVIFFISCLYPIMTTPRLRFYSVIYFLSLLIGYEFGLFWLEMWAVYVLCLCHLQLLWYRDKVSKIS